MLRPYRDVLARPGALAFSAAGFLARLPISMVALGIVLMISGTGRSYALAGGVAAAASLGSAVAGPRLARLVDRYGQARVLRPAATVHCLALGALMLGATARAHGVLLVVTAAVVGLTMTSIGSLVRARWSALLGTGPGLHTAYSLESVLDEMIFIVGPLLVTALSTTLHPAAGLGAVLAATVTGTALLTAQRGTEPATHPRTGPVATAVLRSAGLAVVATVFVALGTVFGVFEVVVVAFASAEGRRGATGVVLALYALGSLLAGLAYGAITWRVPVHRRFLAGAVAMGASVVSLPFVGGVPALAAVAFLAGFAISPTLISGLDLVQSLVPAGRLTEGLAWTTAGLYTGVFVGAAAAGWLVEQVGPRDAFWACTGAGLAAAALAGGGISRLRPDRLLPGDVIAW